MNINSFININKFYKSLRNFNKKKPFPYIVLDGFLKKDIALKIEKNFIKLQDKKLWSYDNFCEIKKSTDTNQTGVSKKSDNSISGLSLFFRAIWAMILGKR